MPRTYLGYFISLEGPDGAGKTSNLPRLADYLHGLGLTVFPTREPGGTDIGEQIRAVIHDLRNTEMNRRTETLLYLACRAQFVETEIKVRLARGEIVLSDRYSDSSLAYQGYGHQQDLDSIRFLNRYSTGGLVPDLTVLLDLEVGVGLARKALQSEWNRLDGYEIDFHRRVREGYLAMAKQEPGRWVLVDASKGSDEVFENLKKVVEGRLISEGFIERGRFGGER